MGKKQVATDYLDELVQDLIDAYPVEDLDKEESDFVVRSSAESLIVAATWTGEQRRWFLALRELKERAIQRGWGGNNATRLAAELQALNDESDGWIATISANVFSEDPITQWECDVIHMALEQGFAAQTKTDLDRLGLTLEDFT
jgi:hypothetical protein